MADQNSLHLAMIALKFVPKVAAVGVMFVACFARLPLLISMVVLLAGAVGSLAVDVSQVKAF